MDMLRADIAKSDSESAAQLALVQDAKDTKLRAAAELDVLSEQISTRDRILSNLRTELNQTWEERDRKEKILRELREEHEELKMSTELAGRRTEAKLSGCREEVVVMTSLGTNLKKRVGELERQLEEESREKSRVLREMGELEVGFLFIFFYYL